MSDYDLPISALGRRRHRRAVAELVDDERRKHGLSRLRRSRRLRLSARAWANALIGRPRLTHGNFARRVLRFPFVLASRGRSWAVAENVARGSGAGSTPRRIVESWMGSHEHRTNLLGAWQYQAVWSKRHARGWGPERETVTVVQHLGRRRPPTARSGSP